jgi:hypothetical protein
VPAAVIPATSTDAYRRAARRLRCRYAGDPGRLQRSLKALASAPASPSFASAPCEDRQGPAVVRNSAPAPVLPLATSASRSFAEHVATTATSSVLRYSQRLQLIRDARRYGISRFEANLVIAVVLGRRRGRTVATGETPDGSWVSPVTTFLIIQGALALGAWWTLFR